MTPRPYRRPLLVRILARLARMLVRGAVRAAILGAVLAAVAVYVHGQEPAAVRHLGAQVADIANNVPGHEVGAKLADTVNNASAHGTATANPAAGTKGSALAALASVAVKGRAPMTGYSRAQFGPAWTDDSTAPDSHNGCDTRDDILNRDLTHVVHGYGGTCEVTSGTLHEPYSGTTVHFVRGVRTSLAVQIDHVVALGDAWQTGAQQLSAAQRRAYANDPGVLLAVDGPLNEQKSDADAASWLPPNKSYRCAYVARQVAIKIKYRLWMTPAEKSAVTTVLRTCPTLALPRIGATVPRSK